MRIFFPKNEQKKIIDDILLVMSVKGASKLCECSERTIRDWRREKFSIESKSLYKLCKKAKISVPSNITIKNQYWYTNKGSSTGGKSVVEKYGKVGGDSEYRKKKWREWWSKTGKYKSNCITSAKPIKYPNFSKELAEFVGIVLGDGGITKRQITITLHSEDDKEYGSFVTNLIKKLFDVPVGVYKCKKDATTNYVVSRTKLVNYCTEKLGLKVGSKVTLQVDVPKWIKENNQYSVACIRGLIDTDGSVFTHKYKVNGKFYTYKKIAFTNLSFPLCQAVFQTLKNNGLNPRIARQRDVWLDSQSNVKEYFQIITPHNQKHLNRYVK